MIIFLAAEKTVFVKKKMCGLFNTVAPKNPPF